MRFALARHDSPRGLHWDFFLEAGESLKTWALAQPPQDGLEIVCQSLGDHRLAYLDYEGPVSADRGMVNRWDSGQFEIESRDDDRWTITLHGQWLVGQVTLTRLSESPEQWRFVYRSERD